MYSGGYSSYKSAGARPDKKPTLPSPGSAARYGIRSSSSVPYGVTSPSYSLPLSSSTLSALALSSSMRYTGSKSTGAYSPASSASSSPRLTSYHPSLSYSRSFTRGSDGYGSWSVRIEEWPGSLKKSQLFCLFLCFLLLLFLFLQQRKNFSI